MAVSGLSTEQRQEMRSTANKLGGKIVQDLSSEIADEYTHLIVDVSYTTTCILWHIIIVIIYYFL